MARNVALMNMRAAVDRYSRTQMTGIMIAWFWFVTLASSSFVSVPPSSWYGISVICPSMAITAFSFNNAMAVCFDSSSLDFIFSAGSKIIVMPFSSFSIGVLWSAWSVPFSMEKSGKSFLITCWNPDIAFEISWLIW